MKKQTKLDTFKEKLKVLIPDVENYEFFHLKGDEFNKKLKAFSAELGSKWVDSNYTDFNWYRHKDYLIECAWTYVVSSGGAVDNMIKYFNSIIPDQKVTVLDVYNGMGLSTLEIAQRMNASTFYFNDVLLQYEACGRLMREYNITSIAYKTIPDFGKYDIVLCLETLEHYFSPMEFTRLLMDMSKEYLVETTSFCSPQHYGHFKEYDINGRIVNGMTASRKVHDLIRTEFVQVFSGFNGRPRIWKRKPTNNLLEM